MGKGIWVTWKSAFMVLSNQVLLQNSVAESRDCLSHYEPLISNFNVTQLHGT